MHELISEDELFQIVKDGGTFEPEEKERGPIQLEGLSEIVSQLARIAKANEEVAAKQSERLTDALERIATACGKQKINLNPIINIARELKELARPTESAKQAYTFTIERDNRGLMQTIKAIPATMLPSETIN